MRATPSRLPLTSYVLNLGLLATHQVDAAYWHEWDVFGVPGGIELFLAFNLVAVLAVAVGLALVAARHPRARLAMWLCAATGFVTVAIHAVFLARDATAFWTPVSLTILGGIAVTSAVQAMLARRVA